MKNFMLHNIVYKAARLLLMPFLKYHFKFNFEKILPQNKPYIVLANHTTTWDPLLVGLSFPEHMYYVASEHIFRHGFLSKLLKYFVAPIMRVKARTEMKTAVNILKALKYGCNVCMFAEGYSSWNGETGTISAATAKLVKRSGISLVTYRIEGGYLTLPRWAKTIRRGSMRGYQVHEYSPDKLSSMTEEEIEHVIHEDLYVNAYTDNMNAPVKYRGKRLAESLETTLYICPSCSEISTLKSEGDMLSCSCGLSLRYTPYGIFESTTEEKAPFTTILEWDRWQSRLIYEKTDYFRNMPLDTPITTDDDQFVYHFEAGKNTKLIGRGKLSLYRDRLVLESLDSENPVIFSLNDITDMAIMQLILSFTVKGNIHYEIKSRHPRSALKYLMLCSCLTNLRVML